MHLEHVNHLMLVYATYLIAVASPGPSNMAIMGVAMSQGRASAVVLALGVMTGSMFWAVLAAAGMSTLLAEYAGALIAIKIAGGLYLLYLAFKSARSALSDRVRPVIADAPGKRTTHYRKGLLLHLTNPKSILGWIAIMSLGLRPDAPPYTLQAIVAGCAILGVTVFVGYALIFSTALMGQAYQKTRRWIEGTLALVFGYAGIRLLLSKT
ncbi:LysE family translocator [Sinorhizobium sp. BG8]|uniref:LysE family translocator n=1 Tax=Sinorhizobium sp. BG8 TaxID=2613773 RepID=UPI00193E68EA|nr:LysE family translocator [Sinorhizobium sp. BG8]QRM54611.1 LysE family translocator [Sinorhizobium sp. BG8]